eukprot:508412_1
MAGESDKYSTCDHLTIPTVAVTSIVSMTTLSISVIAYIKMINFKREHPKKVQLQIYKAQHLFYVMCITYSIGKIPDIIAECWYPLSVFKAITYIIGVSSYYFHWLSLLMIFYLRLKFVFNDTSLQLSKCYNIMSLSVLIGSIPFGLGVVTVAFLFYFDVALVLMALNLLALIIFAQVLICTFIHKLYKLNALHKDENSAHRTKQKFNNLMTKYTILAITSLISSTITFFTLIFTSVVFEFYTPGIYLAIMTCQMMDVLFNLISVSLTICSSMNCIILRFVAKSIKCVKCVVSLWQIMENTRSNYKYPRSFPQKKKLTLQNKLHLL